MIFLKLSVKYWGKHWKRLLTHNDHYGSSGSLSYGAFYPQ
jgi:hypothetical protein